jgi:hypothetical protein
MWKTVESLLGEKMDRYTIVEIPEYLEDDTFKKVFSSDAAEDIGSFMWGRSSGKYAIYKYDRLAPAAHICSEIQELISYLKNIKD